MNGDDVIADVLAEWDVIVSDALALARAHLWAASSTPREDAALVAAFTPLEDERCALRA